MILQQDIEALSNYCKTNLGDPTTWITPDGYPNSLALCLIDSIYSTGSHYTSVENVVKRYQSLHGSTDGVKNLLASFEAAGGPHVWASNVAQNLKPAHTHPGAPLKAEVVQLAAELMDSFGVDTVNDFVSEVSSDLHNNPIHTAWKKLPSQSSEVTYNYLLILAGLPSVKPDRMVLRFLSTALEQDTVVSTDRAIELISATADTLGVSSSALDHTIWRAASGRQTNN